MPYANKKSGFKMKAAAYNNSPMKKNFPDLTGDGKVTRADILKGRGIELDSPAKKYKSDAQRKAVHASKAEQSAMKKRGCKSAYKMKMKPCPGCKKMCPGCKGVRAQCFNITFNLKPKT